LALGWFASACGHADFLARWQIRQCLLIVQSGDGRHHACRSPGRRCHVKQDSPFCPNIAATPDGKQVWLTLKDTGRVMVFDAKPPFSVLKSIDTRPITNHVNIAHNANGTFAYVTVGGLNEVKVFRTDDFSLVATIPVGKLPHGVWPSGDGSRVYVGLENVDSMAAIDAITNKLIATSPVGQAPQAITMCRAPCRRATVREICSGLASPVRPFIFRLVQWKAARYHAAKTKRRLAFRCSMRD
jgi:YVTN family beta-propeller protein